ncbi:FAD-dependent oxidoreductase [Amycolatopsis sp. NBC_01480]|uniref:FAD-dependent oxidoreductase n=1 Tax=Amycolatopsis sp. NBC_01480 TaxID=2903562 RepID=UPI002E27FC82|nr:FAD-dependent oxidoreductase [Amycolatopsis sp. NBC_01480]
MGAARLRDQVVLHPAKYLRGLAAAFVAAGGRIFEGSRVRDVSVTAPYRVRTADGVVKAGHVVVATHYPILDRGLFFARLDAECSYCVAAGCRRAHHRRSWRSAPGARRTRSATTAST